jgi:hypothetical protein
MEHLGGGKTNQLRMAVEGKNVVSANGENRARLLCKLESAQALPAGEIVHRQPPWKGTRLVVGLAADGSGRFAGVVLRPAVRVAADSDKAKAISLHHDAHRMCFIANSVSCPVSIEPCLVE